MSRFFGRLHRNTVLTVLPVLFLLAVIAVAAGAPASTRGTDAEAWRMIDRAAEFVRSNGTDAAVEAFSRRGGAFLDRDLYPMLLDKDGTMVAHGWMPGMNGYNIAGMQDVEGRLFIREALDEVARTGSADVTYQWPDPLSGQVTRKTMHARRLVLNGESYMLAVGVYR
ncbi:cache domain-containing protein [Azospirillum thermophilum]|nr:cache domain-containing protein [Azospirillum thermophilum]